jgi:alpha-galactosidase
MNEPCSRQKLKITDVFQNNWNAFACDVSEYLLLSTSERIVDLGLRDLGYRHVILDDCWQDESGRGTNGKLQPNLEKFPNGMKSVSDHLHKQGLKFGMYSSAGEMTCARFGESRNFFRRHLGIRPPKLLTLMLCMY